MKKNRNFAPFWSEDSQAGGFPEARILFCQSNSSTTSGKLVDRGDGMRLILTKILDFLGEVFPGGFSISAEKYVFQFFF